MLRGGALAKRPSPEVILRDFLIPERLDLGVREVRLVHVHPVALHVREHLAKLAEVVHVKVPEVGALSEGRFCLKHGARVAFDTPQLRLERLGLAEDLLHTALAPNELLPSLRVHLPRVRHHLRIRRKRLQRVPTLELAVAVPKPRHVHRVRGETRELDTPVVLDDVSVEPVVVPNLLHIGGFKVGLEDPPSLVAQRHGINPQQRLGLVRF